MPRERESELRHLGGNALHQLHSTCVKKMQTTRQKEASEFDVLSDLKNFSNRADKLAEINLPGSTGLEEWVAAIKKTMEEIRDCKKIQDIQYPPSIKTYIISAKGKDDKVPSPVTEATTVLQLTTLATKKATSVEKVTPPSVSKVVTPKKKRIYPDAKYVKTDSQMVTSPSASKVVTPKNKRIYPDAKSVKTDSQMVTPATSVRKKAHPLVLLSQLTDQEINLHSSKDSLKNNIKPQTVMQTPVLNLTFNKINTTMVLGSGSAANSNQNSIIASILEDSGVKTRSASKKNLVNDNLNSKTKENKCPNDHEMSTRSGSKRKSSVKNKSSKKQKVDSMGISSTTLSKTSQLRHPLRDLKTSILGAENKAKLSAVVKPSLIQPKQSVVSKEQQTLEEIMKKDKKREENMQRIKAERQQKAEQNKKNREEKRIKTLQKRLQMEKEKEEKRVNEAKKSQTKVIKENPKRTTRTKELVEQHVKESNSTTITSTQSSSNSGALVKTPARKSEDIESYELTPLPDSSTYNFSDDEEEKPSQKRIPLWAQGVHLKSALIQQYYHPIDSDALFGRIIDTPNLVEIFKINKKRYFKRTSSAIWQSSPDLSFHR